MSTPQRTLIAITVICAVFLVTAGARNPGGRHNQRDSSVDSGNSARHRLPAGGNAAREAHVGRAREDPSVEHREVPDDPWMPRPEPPPPGIILRDGPVVRGPFQSIQVNVDEFGVNIPGDAANEPSIAIDPTDPNRIVIGWRQFDSVASDFRQAGWAYSHDGGQTWTFPGVLEPGVFRSDPVLDSDADGNVFYFSLAGDSDCHLFKSSNGGVSWGDGVYVLGGDKQWMTIDRTDGIGRNNIYCVMGNSFRRSTDGGATWEAGSGPGSAFMGTVAVGPDGEVYRASSTVTRVSRSANANDPATSPQFDFDIEVYIGGSTRSGAGPNPVGLLGQMWIACDHSSGTTRGKVYLLSSVDPPGPDPLDVMFTSSADGGLTWSDPVRVNDDPECNGAWQWFGTISVAPNGRLDAIWNDTRNDPAGFDSELYYAYSQDAGETWSVSQPVSPAFDPHVGWPVQQKIGDYYDMISGEAVANVAYAATFNGEQDVYFLRVGDCNENGVHDGSDISDGTSGDCNGNGFPDECEDCDGNGLADECDIIAITSEDCNGNGVPDECEPEDCNSNGAPDVCDIAVGPSHDWNLNGIPDECEPHEIIYVDVGNCPGPGSGTENDPFCTIGDGIDAAPDPVNGIVEVRVANGLYTGPGNKNVNFGGRPITVRSVNGPENCVIDCQNDGGAFRFFLTGETAAARVEGFTIISGSSGAIYCLKAAPTIANCVIENNTGESGAGVMTIGNGSEGPTVINCVIANNTANVRGGGVFNDGSVARLINCDFIGNSAHRGGGLATDRGYTELVNCRFLQNHAAWVGGAMAMYQNSSFSTIADCLFIGNSASSEGGAISHNGPCTSVAANCMLVGNDSGGHGGGIGLLFNANCCLSGCTLSGNRSSAGGGAISVQGSWQGLLNCVLWGDSAGSQGDEIQSLGPDTTVSYCDVEGGEAGVYTGGGTFVWGDGNLEVDPMFASGPAGTWTGNATYDPSTFQTTLTDSAVAWGSDELAGKLLNPDTTQYLQSLIVANTTTTITVWGDFAFIGFAGAAYRVNDYHLTPDSPCIDAGDPSFEPRLYATDLDREPRVAGDRVDIGADEYWDCNGNQTPDYQDLAAGTGQDENNNGILDECEQTPVPLAIKPGSCPNPFNRSSHGYLPVAVVGTQEFDVTTIEVATVRLSRADGVGGSVAPLMGNQEPCSEGDDDDDDDDDDDGGWPGDDDDDDDDDCHLKFRDVVTPFEGALCECHDLGGDGIVDLKMKFSRQDMVAALELAGLEVGDEIELVVTGTLLDGAPFTTAGDCLLIVGHGT